jgi:hypothetical protein
MGAWSADSGKRICNFSFSRTERSTASSARPGAVCCRSPARICPQHRLDHRSRIRRTLPHKLGCELPSRTCSWNRAALGFFSGNRCGVLAPRACRGRRESQGSSGIIAVATVVMEADCCRPRIRMASAIMAVDCLFTDSLAVHGSLLPSSFLLPALIEPYGNVVSVIAWLFLDRRKTRSISAPASISSPRV